MKLYLGIDPGNNGALAAIYPGGHIQTWDAPLRDGSMSEADVIRVVRQAVGRQGTFTYAVIELAQSSPKMGVTSAFNYGCGYGMWLTALAVLKIVPYRVRPVEWKAMIFAGHARKATDKASVKKALSLYVARRLFPTVDLKLAKHDGRAEALLLAEFGRRKNNGE